MHATVSTNTYHIWLLGPLASQSLSLRNVTREYGATGPLFTESEYPFSVFKLHCHSWSYVPPQVSRASTPGAHPGSQVEVAARSYSLSYLLMLWCMKIIQSSFNHLPLILPGTTQGSVTHIWVVILEAFWIRNRTITWNTCYSVINNRNIASCINGFIITLSHYHLIIF